MMHVLNRTITQWKDLLLDMPALLQQLLECIGPELHMALDRCRQNLSAAITNACAPTASRSATLRLCQFR